jgi:hypothetical protein
VDPKTANIKQQKTSLVTVKSVIDAFDSSKTVNQLFLKITLVFFFSFFYNFCTCEASLASIYEAIQEHVIVTVFEESNVSIMDLTVTNEVFCCLL